MSTPYQIRAYRGDEPFAFVSYAHEDADAVFAELAELVAAGYRIYYDEGIHPGHAWHDDLADAIERCSVFILFVTPHSGASRNCMRELNFALDKNRDVLAVHLEEVELPRGLQLAIGDRQAVLRHRFHEVDYRERLHSALSGYLGSPVEDGPGDESEVVSATRTDRSADTALQADTVPSAGSGAPTNAGDAGTGPEAADAAPEAAGARAVPIDRSVSGGRGRLWLGAGLLVAAVVIAIAWEFVITNRADAELQRALLAEYVASAENDEHLKAYMIARGLDDDHRQQPEFLAHWEKITLDANLQIGTDGASVEFTPYLGDEEWVSLGVTPLPDVLTLPRGIVRLRLRKPGYENGDFAIRFPGPVALPADASAGEFPLTPVPVSLTPEGSVAADMVRVPATDLPVWVTRWSSSPAGDFRVALPGFEVARREVSNAEFQVFVDAGGYRNDSFWQGLSYRNAQGALTEVEARAQFVDQTGQAGPAGWSLGRYPAGEGDLPASGISWYEAVAYARFRGLTLPTIHHWARYALAPLEGFAHVAPQIAAASNLNQRAALPVTGQRGLGPWGTYDTAGNVREWVWNASADGARIAMGGSWADYGTDSTTVLSADPMSRNGYTGLRLMRLDPAEPLDPALLEPIDLRLGDVGSRRRPVSDEAFEVMRYQFSANNRKHVRVDVDTVVESDAWRIEEHTLTYADDATFRIYLMRPSLVLPTYQAVVYGPHGGAFIPGRNRSHLPLIFNHAEKTARTGRLVAMPVWANSMERFVPSPTDPNAAADQQRRGALAWYQDSVDTLNYLDSLDYVDHGRIAYQAESYGTSVFGVLLMAMQPRFKAGIFVGSGLPLSNLHPMLDGVHYAPRVTQPMLMLNGAFDPVFPPEESQQPLYDLLGTPPEHKRLVQYPETGHFRYPDHALAREIAAWLDEYLGPVR